MKSFGSHSTMVASVRADLPAASEVYDDKECLESSSSFFVELRKQQHKNQNK